MAYLCCRLIYAPYGQIETGDGQFVTIETDYKQENGTMEQNNCDIYKYNVGIITNVYVIQEAFEICKPLNMGGIERVISPQSPC